MTSPSPTTETNAQQRPRKRRRWVYLVVIIILAIYLARWTYLHLTLTATPRPEYWRAQIAALNPERMHPNRLTAEQGERILDVMNDDSKYMRLLRPADTNPDPLAGEWDATRYDIRDAVRALQSPEFRKARSELLSATQVGWNVPITIYMDESEWTHLRVPDTYWIIWLLIHARWSVEANQDVATAIEDFSAALRMTRQARLAGPVQHCIADHLTLDIAREMILVAKRNEQPVDVRALAASLDEIVDPEPRVERLIEGCRLMCHALIERHYVREGGDWLDVRSLAATYSTGSWSLGMQQPPSRIWNLAAPIFHDLKTVRERIDTMFDSNAPGWSALAGGGLVALPPDEAPGLTILDGCLEGFYYDPQQGLRHCLVARTTLDAVLAMFTIHEHHRQTGQYPETLAELVPDLLPRLPIDRADGQPLRYRQTQQGYVLYSIGSDGHDNGGQGEWEWELCGCEDPETDVVFSACKRREVED